MFHWQSFLRLFSSVLPGNPTNIQSFRGFWFIVIFVIHDLLRTKVFKIEEMCLQLVICPNVFRTKKEMILYRDPSLGQP